MLTEGSRLLESPKFSQPRKPQRRKTNTALKPIQQKVPCKYCLAVKPSIAFTHSLHNCFELNQDKMPSARATAVTDTERDIEHCETDEENYDYSNEESYQEEEVAVNSCSTMPSSDIVKINTELTSQRAQSSLVRQHQTELSICSWILEPQPA